ncbi:hypothetical protein Q2T72_22015 [Yersinia sp. 2466 StPb PI]
MSASVIRARVDANIKAAAKANTQALGMDLSTSGKLYRVFRVSWCAKIIISLPTNGN